MFFFVVTVTVTVTAAIAVVVAAILTITFTVIVAFVLLSFLILQIHVKLDFSSFGMPLMAFGYCLAMLSLLFACTCRMDMSLAPRA